MKNVLKFLFTIGLLLTVPASADWGIDIMSIDAVKHWHMDDRVAHVRGTITEVFGREGFMLSDDTGEIRIRLSSRDLQDFDFHRDMRVEVRGRVLREHHHWDLDATAVKLHDDAVIGHF